MANIDDIRAKIKASAAKKSDGGSGGQRKNRMLWLRDGEPVTVRFLDEIADAQEYVWYNKYEGPGKENINVFGPENWGGEDEEEKFLKAMKELGAKKGEQLCFRVWNEQEKAVQIFNTKMVPVSVAFHLVKALDKHGTICDRDYTLEKNGTASSTVYTVEKEDKEPVSKEALEDLKTFGWDEVVRTLKMVNKIPDKYASAAELEKRKARAEAREANDGKKSTKEEKTEKPKKAKKEESLPWEDVGNDSKDEERVKKAVDLDSYDED